jgi:hypothetical protein
MQLHIFQLFQEKRKKRMLDNEVLDDDEGNADDSKIQAEKRMIVISGDDLGDSLFSYEEQGNKGWVDEVLKRSEEESDDGSSASEETEEDENDSDLGEKLIEQYWE